MVTVAVAGGTGSVGKTIVDAIFKARKHEVIVLTRTVHKQTLLPDHHHEASNSVQPSKDSTPSAPACIVDYSNVEQVAGVLESKKVHTIISAIAVMDEISGDSERKSMRRLLASESPNSMTLRFSPSIMVSCLGDQHNIAPWASERLRLSVVWTGPIDERRRKDR